MRKIRIYYPNLNEKQVGNKLALRDPIDIKHLKVLRADQSNYTFEIADGNGLVGDAELKQLTKEGVLFVLKSLEDRASETQNTLVFPVIHPAAMEIAIDQSVQLDLYSRIILYFADYNRLSENRISDNKLARLEKIAIAAFKQSFASVIPELVLADGLSDALEQSEGQIIVPHLDESSKPASDLKPDGNFTLVIGPEGGFSEKEVDLLKAQKYTQFIKLGHSVLTSETAATVFGGLVKSDF